MANTLKFITNSIKYWWISAIAGGLLIATGVYMFSDPDESFQALSMVFSATMIIAGILLIAFAISNSENLKGWGWYLVLGILTLAAGIYLVSSSDLSEQGYVLFIDLYFLFLGILAIGTSLDLKDYGIDGWGWLTVLGVLLIIFSYALFQNPQMAGMTAVAMAGIGFIVAGIVFIYISFQLKYIKDTPDRVSSDLKDKANQLQQQIQDALASAKQEVQNAANNVSSSSSGSSSSGSSSSSSDSSDSDNS